MNELAESYVELIREALNIYLDVSILQQKSKDSALKPTKHTPIQIRNVLNIFELLGKIDIAGLMTAAKDMKEK